MLVSFARPVGCGPFLLSVMGVVVQPAPVLAGTMVWVVVRRSVPLSDRGAARPPGEEEPRMHSVPITLSSGRRRRVTQRHDRLHLARHGPAGRELAGDAAATSENNCRGGRTCLN